MCCCCVSLSDTDPVFAGLAGRGQRGGSVHSAEVADWTVSALQDARQHAAHQVPVTGVVSGKPDLDTSSRVLFQVSQLLTPHNRCCSR